MRLYSEGLCCRYKVVYVASTKIEKSRFLLRSESNFEAHLACKQHIFSIALASYVIWHLIFLFMTCFFWSWLAFSFHDLLFLFMTCFLCCYSKSCRCLFIYLFIDGREYHKSHGEIRLIDCLLIPGTEVMKKSLGSPSTQCIGPYWVCYSSKQV